MGKNLLGDCTQSHRLLLGATDKWNSTRVCPVLSDIFISDLGTKLGIPIVTLKGRFRPRQGRGTGK